MTTNYNDRTWKVTTRDQYYDMLEVLPPAIWRGTCFAVGEPVSYDETTHSQTYDIYIEIDGTYYTALKPIRTFNPGKFAAEIRQQFDMSLESI